MNLAHSELVRLLDYKPETGFFIWKAKRCGTKRGHIAGAIDPAHGYRRIKINGRLYLAHRLAWFYTHGEWPAHEIDHIDRVRANNSLSNLRPATRSENQMNKPVYSNSRTGVKGVHWHKQHRKYCATIQHQKRSRHLGLFPTIEQAASAYRAASQKLHGAFSAKV